MLEIGHDRLLAPESYGCHCSSNGGHYRTDLPLWIACTHERRIVWVVDMKLARRSTYIHSYCDRRRLQIAIAILIGIGYGNIIVDKCRSSNASRENVPPVSF